MSFLRKGLFVSAGNIFGVVLSLLAGILFSRLLGPDGVGQIQLFRSVSLTLTTLLAMGIGQASIYFLNNRKVPPEQIVSDSLRLSIVVGTVLAIALTGSFLLKPDYFGEVSPVTAVFYALGASALFAMSLLRPVLTAQLSVRRLVMVEVIQHVFLLAAAGALALAQTLTTELALVVSAGGYWISLAFLLAYLRRYIRFRLPFDWHLLVDVIKYGVRLAAANVLYIVASNVTVMLLRLFSQEDFTEVGLYTRAVTLSNLVVLVPRAISRLLYAKWSGLPVEQKRRQVEMASRMNTTYGLAAAAFAIVFGKLLLALLYGEEFVAGYGAMVLLAPAIVFTTLQSPCIQLLSSEGRAGLTVWAMAGTVIVIGVTSVLAIPSLGIHGAALAALLGNAFAALALLGVTTRLYGVRPLHCVIMRTADFRYVISALRGSRRPASQDTHA